MSLLLKHSLLFFWTFFTVPSFNDIRSLSERVIYLRYDIALRAMKYASRMKERILYHIATKEQYIIRRKPYIISP